MSIYSTKLRYRAFLMMFNMQMFGVVSNSAFSYPRDSERGSRNGDVSRVGALQTKTDIVDSVPVSDSELARLVVLFWLVVFTRQSYLQSRSAT